MIMISVHCSSSVCQVYTESITTHCSDKTRRDSERPRCQHHHHHCAIQISSSLVSCHQHRHHHHRHCVQQQQQQQGNLIRPISFKAGTEEFLHLSLTSGHLNAWHMVRARSLRQEDGRFQSGCSSLCLPPAHSVWDSRYLNWVPTICLATFTVFFRVFIVWYQDYHTSVWSTR